MEKGGFMVYGSWCVNIGKPRKGKTMVYGSEGKGGDFWKHILRYCSPPS
jgi:hypothetical protein